MSDDDFAVDGAARGGAAVVCVFDGRGRPEYYMPSTAFALHADCSRLLWSMQIDRERAELLASLLVHSPLDTPSQLLFLLSRAGTFQCGLQ